MRRHAVLCRLGRLLVRGLASSAMFGLLLGAGLSALPSAASAQSSTSSFDHVSTGFPLTGAHEQVRCEACHIKAIFKGTPRDCATCHVQNNQRGALARPNNHIQTTDSCDSCHTVASFTGAMFSHVGVAPGSCARCHNGINAQGQSANHLRTTLSCDQCHVTSAFVPVRKFDHSALGGVITTCATCHDGSKATGRPANHIATPDPTLCGSCHIASTQTGFASFAGGQMDHAGIASGCATCHGPGVTGGTFAGINSIVVMPPTAPAGPGSHIPSSTTCESCHLASNPIGRIAANAASLPPGSGFASPTPTNAQIHAGITGGCNACHEASNLWMGMAAYPIAPTTLVASAQYTGFQTRPRSAGGTYNVADAAHPATGDCSQCHSGTNFFSGDIKPANHIPTSATAQCTACHTSADFSVLPTLADIHANAPSTSSNCAQCHGAAAPSFAIPAANFSIVDLPSNHVPTSAACELCHVGPGSSVPATPVGNGAKFSGSLMSHSGITNNCVACHGPSINGSSFAGIGQIVVLPPTSPVGPTSHIPSSTTCESCHLGTVPSGQIAAVATKTAPGTAFASPAPTTAQIHSGITGGCNACHEASNSWMGMAAYPIAPTTLVAGAQYTGFQTRPRSAAGTYNVADIAHPASGDCSQCHSGTNFFTALDKPANHIPTSATAQCTACHTSADFSVLPTLADIHANAPSTSSNCAQCHGTAAPSFAIPAANFSIVGLPGNHIPTSAACELCHVGPGSSVPATPVGNGAKFSGSLMSHSGITNNCVACHGPSITGSSFIGVTKIIVMPATSPVGAGSHIPSSTTCESCHLGTVPAGPIAAAAMANVPGSAFATPAPTTVQIHSGITSGCNACHEASFVWMGMAAYPIAPTTLVASAQYTGFQTRPRSAAGTYNVADAVHPATGDCSQCHSGTNFFSGDVKPNGHIPTTLTTCSTCHVVAGDFSTAGLTANLSTLHTGISSNCIACHSAGAGYGPFAGCATQAACSSPPPLTYQPKPTPLAAGGSPTTPSSATHVPSVGITCEKCHSPSVFTSFAGMNMKGNTNAHVAVGAYTCITCHEGGPPAYTWFGVNIVTRPVGHQGRKAGQDCISSGCHNRSYTQFDNQARVRPVLRAAVAGANTRLLPDGSALPTIGAAQGFDHQGVLPGQCMTCHNGRAARGEPARHLVTRASCDSCHRTTAWVPAQFSHQGVLPGQCQTCHNASSATGKSSGHFVTARSCDACHRTIGWVAVNYSHVSPLYRSAPDRPTCVSCHVTNGEIIPRQLRGGPRPRPVPPGP
jgi:hypothetical protein